MYSKIYNKVIEDKETYKELSDNLSCLNILFNTLLKFVGNNNTDNVDKINIKDSLEIVKLFLQNNHKDIYYRFLNVLSNNQIHFISYNDLQEILPYILNYIYNIVSSYNKPLAKKELTYLSNSIYDTLLESNLTNYLTLFDDNLETIIKKLSTINPNDYNNIRDNYIKKVVQYSNSSFAIGNDIYIIYYNNIKDVFSILHEFIHPDNISIDNILNSYNQRNYNYYLNEIPSIMMEYELYKYITEYYPYDLSFYLTYRLKSIGEFLEYFYIPTINIQKDNIHKYGKEYLPIISKIYTKYSQNNSLICMITCESDNSKNLPLSYILAHIISMYAMTLDQTERTKIFNYIRTRITSNDNFFDTFKSIGIDITNVEELSKLTLSLYKQHNSMTKTKSKN